MGKIMAQRKFAQGVYVPPHSAQITNRKVTDLVKDQTNIIRRQTTAKVLLDVISLENIHKHKPVVLLERLRNVDAVENIIEEPDNSLIIEVNSPPSVTIKSLPQTQITGRNPLLKRSGPKKNLKRSIRNRHKVKQRRNPIRKAAFKASLRWKYASTADSEFSIDDDQPLTYFTRSSYINGSRQNAIILGSKKNNSGPKSTSSYVVERLPPSLNNGQESSTTVETDAVLESSMNDEVEAGSTLHITDSGQPTQINEVEAGSTLHITDAGQPTQINEVEAGSTLHITDSGQPTQINDARTLHLSDNSILYDDDMLLDSKSDIFIQDADSTPSWRAPIVTSLAPYRHISDPWNDETQPGPSGLRSRSTLRREWTKSELSDTSSNAETPIDDWAQPGTSGVQSSGHLEVTPDDDGAQPGPSGTRSSAQESTNGVQPGSSRNQGRKGKAKDKSKGAPPPDTTQPGPSSLQSSSYAQSELDWAQPGPSGLQIQHIITIDLSRSDNRAQSPVNSESSYDDNSHRAASPTNTEESLACGMSRAEDPESRNKMIRVWLENGIFKVPTVPKARTSQNSPHPSMEEERPRRHQQSGGRRSTTPSQRLGSERSSSPMSNITMLDNTEPEQVIDADATEISVPTRRDRIQMLPLRRQRVRFERAKMADAPSFHPTEEEFKDPVSYFEKIMPCAAKYGLCKVVAPPGFKPQCNLNDAMRFTVFNQYITRVFRRWSSLTREMCTIRSHLATLKIACTQPPLLGGMEVNLPKLYQSVNNNGGLKNMNKKTWTKVAEELNCGKLSHPDRRLDQLYMKYVVPYTSLGKRERKEMIRKVEELWQKRHRRMLDRASNPLHSQKHMLGESDSSDDDGELEDEKRFPHLVKQLKEAEECIVKGRPMDLLTFKRIANNVQKRYLPTRVTIDEIENSYWSSALMAEHHVCVHSASIETSSEGYGFTNNSNEPYGQHPWNLKMLNQNNGNILRLLGSVVGLTIPTLHLGMLYSTSCWHRDPHGLPWMEYMHEGPPKIWYGIPDEESERFRRAVEILCPTSCQNKSIWLPSDITMIPPNFLLEHSVSLSRLLQNPGEFVIVFPKAYSCSIATGFTVSESVYFAYNHWINNIGQVFQELRDSCEPSMFSLEHLLISAATDPRASLHVLQLVHASMSNIVDSELFHRAALIKHGLKPRFEKRNNPTGIVWNISEEDECEICRANLYLSRVNGVFDRDGALCVGHALQVLDERVKNIRRRSQCHYELIIYITETELKQIVERISKRLVDVRMSQAFPRVV